MPTCRARYRFDVDESNLKTSGPGVLDALAEEERELDDWGEPGHVIRRRWIHARAWDGRDYSDRLNSGSYWPRGRLEPIGPVEWSP
jgi:hypothetical protein